MRREVQSGIVGIFLLSVLGGCGGDRRSGAVPADTLQTPAADTAAAKAAPAADTGTVVPPETSASRRDTSSKPAAPTLAQKPAPKPAPPAPRPAPAAPKPAAPKSSPAVPESAAAAQPEPADTPTTATLQPAPSSETGLRDQYHQAPKDTVTQVVYDGWKQYNLNCARCHGEDVQGTTIAPHLIVSVRPDGPVNTKELFVQTVCAGRPEKGMPSWCALGMEMGKIESIYSYVKGRSEGKVHPGRPAVKPAG